MRRAPTLVFVAPWESSRSVAQLPRTPDDATEGLEWEMQQSLSRAAALLDARGLEQQLQPDRGFLATRDDFTRWAGKKKECRMKFFHHEMRRKHGVLLEADGKPTGGEWNFDAENRKPWPKGKPVPERMTSG